MGIALLLIVLALLFLGVGVFVSALKWALIIAAVLFIAGIVSGFAGRGRSTV